MGMTKQEEIQKALAKELLDLQGTGYDSLEAAEWILGILDALGVVIKVDRELPLYPGPARSDPEWIPPEEILYLEAQVTMVKAGYVAVEPLVEEYYFNNERFERG